MLKGLPASGKTTYAKKLVDEQGYKRINKDDLRAMIDNGKWSKRNEEQIIGCRNIIIKNFILDGNNVVVDDTNLDPKHQKTLLDISDKFCPGEFEVKEFKTSVEECIERDSKREKPVGEKVIRDMNNKYKFAPEKKEIKQKAIICDIDGTIAIKGNRNIFDYSKVHLDTVNQPVYEILKNIPKDVVILFCSGRDDNCKNETLNWLFDNLKTGHKVDLFMRTTGDKRPDDIVKEEIYKNYIEPNYEIIYVLDDRQKVVDMWRRIGLTCLQVAPGNF